MSRELFSQARARREFSRALEFGKKVLILDPWREDIVHRIVAMRYEMGDRAGALDEYRTFSARLREGMGIDPMAETVALAETIERSGEVQADEAFAGGPMLSTKGA